MSYVNDFNKALGRYSNKKHRPGYTSGWFFSRWRHSNKLYPHIQELLINLNAHSDSPETQKKIITDYLKSPKTRTNDYSFSLYFLDILVKNHPHEGFEEYYPQDKSLVFYSGRLYRGSLQPPESALAKGMEGGHSNSVEDYANDTNMTVGLSTSKSQKVAQNYQATVHLSGKSAFVQKGYVYEIDYRGEGGIDIVKTLKKRERTATLFFAERKQEVNIIGKVPPEDIVGYWDTEGKRHKNELYQKNKQTAPSSSLYSRLKRLF